MGALNSMNEQLYTEQQKPTVNGGKQDIPYPKKWGQMISVVGFCWGGLSTMRLVDSLCVFRLCYYIQTHQAMTSSNFQNQPKLNLLPKQKVQTNKQKKNNQPPKKICQYLHNRPSSKRGLPSHPCFTGFFFGKFPTHQETTALCVGKFLESHRLFKTTGLPTGATMD